MKRRARFLCRSIVLPMLAVGIVGCADNGVTFSTWESLDVDLVRARINNPTGAIADAQAEEFLAAVERLIPYVRDAARLVLRLVELVDEVSGRQEDGGTVQKDGETSEPATGTQAFFGVACPGRGEEPEPDFTHGMIRVETPTLQSEDDLATILEDNDILIQFEDCEMPSVTLRGPVPARFLASEVAMVLWFEALGLTSIQGDAADVEGDPELFDGEGDPLVNLGLAVAGVAIQLSANRDALIRLDVVFGPPDDSYTFELLLSTTSIAVTINAVDGTIGCRYDVSADVRLDCDLAGDL